MVFNMEKNYVALDDFSILYDHYAFSDVPEHFAEHLFIRHQVTVRFGREYRHPEQPFIVVFCKVRKRDRERFLEALTELDRKMTLCGYPGYDSFCGRFMKEMKGRAERNWGKRCRVDVAGSADKAE